MRLHQATIEEALLSDSPINRALGRLLATGIFDKFEQWLNDENPDTSDKAVETLNVTSAFAVYLLAGVLSEFFKNSSQAQDAAKKLFLAHWSTLHDID